MTYEEYMSLNVGDMVICNKSSQSYKGKSSCYVEGTAYLVKEKPSPFRSVRTVTDSNGSTSNGWHYEYFDLIHSYKTFEDCL
jgi:hypothetical protein